MISTMFFILSFLGLCSAQGCNQAEWGHGMIGGADSPWCFQAHEFPEYPAKNGKNGPCTAAVCKVYDLVESKEKCHDIILGSALCDDKWGFQYSENGGRCWAKGEGGTPAAAGDNWWVGPLDRENPCEGVDECAMNTHDCGDNANCIDTADGYECECQDGYTGDGRSCVSAASEVCTNCRCADWDSEHNGYTYNGCLGLAESFGFEYFSLKDDKCRVATEAECLPHTTGNYGWTTYQLADEATTTDEPTTMGPYGTAMCTPEAPYGVPTPNGRGEGICCTEPLMNAECPPDTAIGYCFHDYGCIGDQGALCQTGIGANCIDYERVTEIPESHEDCPSDPPSVGTSCNDNDLDCYYGDVICCCDSCKKQQLVSCSMNGRWISFMEGEHCDWSDNDDCEARICEKDECGVYCGLGAPCESCDYSGIYYDQGQYGGDCIDMQHSDCASECCNNRPECKAYDAGIDQGQEKCCFFDFDPVANGLVNYAGWNTYVIESRIEEEEETTVQCPGFNLVCDCTDDCMPGAGNAYLCSCPEAQRCCESSATTTDEPTTTEEPIDAIKKSVVKRLFKIVPRMVERTKGNIRRVVGRMKRDMERPDANFHQDEIDIISDIDQHVDIDEAIPFGRTMENIDRLNAFYHENGEPRDNTHDSLDAGQVRVLLRVAGTKHQVGYKADLNRQMNKIIDIRDDEGLNYGLTYNEDELESLTADRNMPAYNWLPFAYIQYHELSEKYRDDGTMKN